PPRRWRGGAAATSPPARRRHWSLCCDRTRMPMNELLIAVNSDPDSRLPYLLRVPLAGGMVFRTSGTWPHTNAIYCYPVTPNEWPDEPEIMERAPLRSCVRRGAAIDLVLDWARENRSQLGSLPPGAGAGAGSWGPCLETARGEAATSGGEASAA